MSAVYGENFGLMRLEEDDFETEAEAHQWLKENKFGSEALANWKVYWYSENTKSPLTRPISN